MVETGAQKRKAEDETAALANDTLGDSADAPAAKRVKSEPDATPATTVPAAADNGTSSINNDILGAAAQVKQEDNNAVEVKAEELTEPKEEPEENNAEAASGSDTVAQGSDQAQTLGYKTFTSGATAFQYFHELINDLRHDQDVNEYEFKALLDLIKKGHPDADSKVGSGIRAFQVREHEELTSTCFYLLREDGTEDNFSVRKCVCNLFPKWGESNARKPHDFAPRGGGRGGRGGRGGGGRSSGGRSSGGRGRGGRRGRGRGRGRG